MFAYVGEYDNLFAVSKKADRNKVERKTARQDVPLAKNTHKEEEAIAQQERLQHLNRQRELLVWASVVILDIVVTIINVV